MGGLVSRYYLEKLGGQETVPVLITLGTPHLGTEKARTGVGPAARQMVPGSEFLGRLKNERSTKTRVFAFWSNWDSMVIPPQNAALEDSNIPVHHLGHNGFLFSRKVANLVYKILVGQD